MLRPRNLLNREGAVTYKALIWTVILFFGIYSGYKYLLPTFSYYMLKTDVEAEAKLAHMYTDETLKRRILTKAGSWNIPITVEDIEITRGLRNIAIKIYYSKTITFFGRYKKRLDYRIETSKPLKETSGILR